MVIYILEAMDAIEAIPPVFVLLFFLSHILL